MSQDVSDLVESAKRVIDDNRYLTLGTADAQGNPWVSPVWYATNGYTKFLWLSSADARHSKNIAARSRVAVVIFDSRSVPAGARALYIDGHANEVRRRAGAGAGSLLGRIASPGAADPEGRGLSAAWAHAPVSS